MKKSLPQTGSIEPEQKKLNTALILTASYTDKGGPNIKALTGRNSIVLQSNTAMFTGKEDMKGNTAIGFNGVTYMIIPSAEGWFGIDSIDLTGIKAINIFAGWQQPPTYGFDFELKLETANGKTLGKGSLTPPADKKSQQGMVHINIDAINDHGFHKIYVISKPKDPKEIGQVGVMGLQFNSR